MTPLPATSRGSAHVEACRSTGSSPGAGRIVVRLDLDHHGPASVPVCYEVHGPAAAPAVVVLGGISASRHLAPTPDDAAPGWWPGLVGRGSALDPDRLRLIGVDWLGGPESPWRPSAPLTTHDHARGVLAVLNHLGIEAVTLVGASFGGMVALAFGVLFPERARHLVVLCATHRPHPLATAVRGVQRDVVRLGAAAGREGEAVALARALAMTTYRSEAELDARFDHRARNGSDPARFPVEDYLHARGRAFAERFDADAFVRLSESIDLHDVAPERIEVPTTLVSVDSDVLAPPRLVDELERRAPGVVRHHRLSSPYGHDAFLKEHGAVSDILNGALAGAEVAS